MSTRITRQEPLARTLIALCPDPGRILISDAKEAFKQTEISLEHLLERIATLETSLLSIQSRVESVGLGVGEVVMGLRALGDEVHTLPTPSCPLSIDEISEKVSMKINSSDVTSRLDALKAQVSAHEDTLLSVAWEGRALRGELSLLKTMQRQTFDLVQKDGRMLCLDVIQHIRNTLAVHSSEACTLTFTKADGADVRRLIVRGMQLIPLDAGVYTLTSTIPKSETLQLSLF